METKIIGLASDHAGFQLKQFVKKYLEEKGYEGQIDALVAWSRGIPAVALFGAGTTDKQIELLDKSGIRHFILMYDNDLAGQHGAMRLKQGLSKDKLITEVIMPKGKDISSCTTQEFYDILKKYNLNIKNVFT